MGLQIKKTIELETSQVLKRMGRLEIIWGLLRKGVISIATLKKGGIGCCVKRWRIALWLI